MYGSAQGRVWRHSLATYNGLGAWHGWRNKKSVKNLVGKLHVDLTDIDGDGRIILNGMPAKLFAARWSGGLLCQCC
jgi:hypothetical protein